MIKWFKNRIELLKNDKQLEGDNSARYYCTANCHHIFPCPVKNKGGINDKKRV